MTFSEVLTWLGQHGLSDLSRFLALLRVQDVHDIMELTPEELRDAGRPPRSILRFAKRHTRMKLRRPQLQLWQSVVMSYQEGQPLESRIGFIWYQQETNTFRIDR